MKFTVGFPENLYRAIYGYSQKDRDLHDVDYDYDLYKGCNLIGVLDLLTNREKQYLIMYFKDQLTYKAIGEVCNITAERVKQIIARGLRKLRHPKRRKLIVHGFQPVIDDHRYATFDIDMKIFDDDVSYTINHKAFIEKTDNGHLVHTEYIPKLKIYTESLINALDK